MSMKNACTTSDYLVWDDMLRLVRQLYRDKKYRMSLFIGCGCFFGLRVSDLRRLTWSMILENESFEVIEKKTGKLRRIRVNSYFQKHIVDCFHALGIENKAEYCFLSQKGCIYSTQRLNVILKQIKRDYGLNIEHFSTHTLRKTFGRKVVESSPNDKEMALIKLSELFNHDNVATTRRYLALRREELEDVYLGLDF